MDLYDVVVIGAGSGGIPSKALIHEALTKSGIEVNAFMRTISAKVYAIGDVVGTYQFSHMTIQNAILPINNKINYDNVAWVTFTEPEIARAGGETIEEIKGILNKKVKVLDKAENNQKKRGLTMKVSLIIVVIISLMALYMVVKNGKVPGGLGITDGKLAPMPKSPNAVSSQSDDPDKKVDPIPFKGDLVESKQWIKKALEAYGNINIVTDDSNYIHVVNTTITMKYNDDLEFYFDESTSLIHFRSASRVGYSDAGLNRKRYDSLLELLK